MSGERWSCLRSQLPPLIPTAVVFDACDGSTAVAGLLAEFDDAGIDPDEAAAVVAAALGEFGRLGLLVGSEPAGGPP